MEEGGRLSPLPPPQAAQLANEAKHEFRKRGRERGQKSFYSFSPFPPNTWGGKDEAVAKYGIEHWLYNHLEERAPTLKQTPSLRPYTGRFANIGECESK